MTKPELQEEVRRLKREVISLEKKLRRKTVANHFLWDRLEKLRKEKRESSA